MNPRGRLSQDIDLCIRRRGTFEVGWKAHKTQCGLYGEHIMTYDVVIRGREIDCPRGWLLDNNDIPGYFETTYKSIREFRTCEYVALSALDAFRVKCRSYSSTPNYIRVAVSGITDSEIAAEWSTRRHV